MGTMFKHENLEGWQCEKNIGFNHEEEKSEHTDGKAEK